ncbi:ABC transporter permease [Dyadobacter subterraneus]|uniref:ABC transporter permease n=1 Tax=Dyadobacter subterraneus TaxID=2773304 RepID=A0ABR9W634_9BACT|nr:ABC transporter permease [Dyadobacter subterraneus]MBE9460922.1 ABC transporter permease [Dyadobacter subterraneus]
MITNHIKVAFRNFRRQIFFSLVNVTGLGVGLAACWLIGIYVYYERSFDEFLPDADRIYSVTLDMKMGDQEFKTTNTPPPIGPRLAADYPEIETTARTFNLGSAIVRRNIPGQESLQYNEDRAIAADTSFLKLFAFPMKEGGLSALDNTGSLVLTEKMGKKYFGTKSPVGQSLEVNGAVYTITGVMKDLPVTSSLQVDFLLPMANFKVVENFAWSWIWLQVDTWAKFREKPTPEVLANLESKFPAMIRKFAPAAYERVGQDLLKQLQNGDRLDVKLMPLKSLHLNATDFYSRLSTLGDKQQVNIFSIVGGLILLLACVNFMNLSTARSIKRTKEVGIRRALGSNKGILVSQFLTESLLFSVISMALASVLTILALPFFNKLTSLNLTVSDLFSPEIIPFIILLPLLTGLLCGLYPAFYFSRFKTIDISKMTGTASTGGNAFLRSSLVVFQFTVSIVLMLGAFVVYEQLNFATKVSPGLQRENVLIIENVRHLASASAKETFRQELLRIPGAVSATYSSDLPSRGSFGDYYEPEQGDQNHAVIKNLLISSFLTDVNFIPTMGMKIISGRNFLSDTGSDSTSVILNEAAVKAIGWTNAVGKWMRYPGNRNQRFQVVGVMKDFYMGSVKVAIEPMAIFNESSKTYQTWNSNMAVRLRPGSEKNVTGKVASLWKSAVPSVPFQHDFLDSSFARLYNSEAKTSVVLSVFTGLALFVGCLGLFALSAFTAEQRTKEIGIRKVLGASVAGLVALLSKDFLKLVFIAIVVSVPLAWYAVDKWLQNYKYRIEISWSIFVVAAVSAILISLLTVSFQSIKASLANPVKSLRSE